MVTLLSPNKAYLIVYKGEEIMNKIMILIVVLILLSGCNMVQDIYTYSLIGEGFDTFYMEEWETISSIKDAMVWIKYNVELEEDDVDIWKSPKDTISDGFGDCEDIAVLLCNIMFISSGIEMNVVTVMEERSIVSGGSINHTIAEYDGIFYDIMFGDIINDIDVGYIYTFNEIFKENK